MQWYELAMNPRAISEVYTDGPSLPSVLLKEVILSNKGGSSVMILKIDLSRFPDNIPPRWKFKEYSNILLQLDFWAPEAVEVSHQSGADNAAISIEALSKKQISLKVISSSWNIQAYALME